MNLIILITILKILSIIIQVLIAVAFFTVAERKIMGAIQRRKKPNVIGFLGLLQALADGLKLFVKETTLPSNSNIIIFILAPLSAFVFRKKLYGILCYFLVTLFFMFFLPLFAASNMPLLLITYCFNLEFLIRVIMVFSIILNAYKTTGISKLPWFAQLAVVFPQKCYTTRNFGHVVDRLFLIETQEIEDPDQVAAYANWTEPPTFLELEKARQSVLNWYAGFVASDLNKSKAEVLEKILRSKNPEYYLDELEVLYNGEYYNMNVYLE